MRQFVAGLALIGSIICFGLCIVRWTNKANAISSRPVAQNIPFGLWPPMIADVPVRDVDDHHGSLAFIELTERVNFLVDYNLDDKVRLDMRTDLNTRGLVQLFRHQEGQLAVFAYLPPSQQISGAGSASCYPVMIIDPEYVAGLKTRDEILQGMLVLRHEYHHRRQQGVRFGLNARCPERPPSCELFWKDEEDAYWADCKFAQQWGLPSATSPLCRTLPQLQDFRKVLHGHLMLNPYNQGRTECHSIWRKMAGLGP